LPAVASSDPHYLKLDHPLWRRVLDEGANCPYAIFVQTYEECLIRSARRAEVADVGFHVAFPGFGIYLGHVQKALTARRFRATEAHQCVAIGRRGLTPGEQSHLTEGNLPNAAKMSHRLST
jgi:hypothetical protein